MHRPGQELPAQHLPFTRLETTMSVFRVVSEQPHCRDQVQVQGKLVGPAICTRHCPCGGHTVRRIEGRMRPTARSGHSTVEYGNRSHAARHAAENSASKQTSMDMLFGC